MSLWCGGHSKINNVFSYRWTVLWEGLLNLIENFNLISKIRMNLFEFIWWYQLIYSNLRLLVRDLPSAWMKSALPLSKCLPFLEELLSHYLLFFWSFVKVSAFPKQIITLLSFNFRVWTNCFHWDCFFFVNVCKKSCILKVSFLKVLFSTSLPFLEFVCSTFGKLAET